MKNASSIVVSFGCICVTLAFGTSCSEGQAPSERAAETIAAPLTVPVPTLNQFAALARTSASFGQRSQVTGGDVGVAASGNGTPNSLTGDIDSRIGIGEVLLAQRVVLADRAVVGEIGANQIVAPNATTGPRSPFVAPPAVPTPGSVTPGTTAVNVAAGQTSTLAAGRFGVVTVSGTLNLSGGLYELRSLQLNPDARLVVQAQSTVRVLLAAAIADRAQAAPVVALGPRGLRLIVAGVDGGGNSVALGTDARLSALIVAQGSVRGADRASFSGSIAAGSVILGNDGRLAFATGLECSSNAGCNDGNPCTVDACVDAQCTHVAAANGSACSDGNACTQTDTCQAGVCAGANPRVCAALDQCHVAGVCNPADGVCSNPNRPNGTSCSDNSLCTLGDVCQSGACSGAPVVCSALDQCHDPGACNAGTGLCTNPPKPNGAACVDSNACTTSDTCLAGACTGGVPVVCSASDQCHDPGSCDSQTGTCSNPVKADGAACSDGNGCTQTDTCQAGSCAGENPRSCVALDECHVAGSCDPATGACSDPAAPDGIACDDGDVCSLGDQCLGGTCSGGTELAVSEFPSGLSRPRSIVWGPGDALWFVAPESSFAAADGSIARITTEGVVTAIPVQRELGALLYGPDGRLWVGERLPGGLPALGCFDATTNTMVGDFTNARVHELTTSNDGGNPIIWFTGGSSVGRMTTAGQLLAPVPTLFVTRAITAAAPAPSTVIWVTEANGGGFALIGRLAFPNLQQFAVTTPGELPGIVEGPDGGIWFTDPARNELGRMPASGGVAIKYALPTAASDPYAITSAPDGNLWVSLRAANKLARVTPAGEVTEICIPTSGSEPTHLSVGADGNLWFTETGSGKIGRVQLME